MSSTTLQSALLHVNRPARPSPVIVSIPHAGRIYPQEILDEARVPQMILERLEDSWCDQIAAQAVQSGATVVQALGARAVADCNRSEWQMAPTEVSAELRGHLGAPGIKERSGLGVVPTRLAGVGALWKRPVSTAQLERRLELLHRPYHRQLAMEIDVARRCHGIAILIDLHSMPSIGAGYAGHGQSLIIGDRFGQSAGAWLSQLAQSQSQSLAVAVGRNQPYAGGHILARHGRPEAGVHAVQLEFDRNLYLTKDRQPDQSRLSHLAHWFANFVAVAADPAHWPVSRAEAAE